MGRALYTNNAAATLAAGISNVATTITLNTGQGSLFPSPTGTDYFYGTLVDAAVGNVIEIVKCTARTSDTLTVVRAQEGTTAQTYAANDKFELRVTASGYTELAAQAGDNSFSGANTFTGATAVRTTQFSVEDTTDPTKIAKFNTSGISTGTTRTYSFGNASGTFPTLENDIQGKNRIINGRMLVDQRNAGAAQTITAGAALAYTVDRFWAACTGANVQGQQVVGGGYQFTGAASVTAIQFGQRIERLNSLDLAGGNASLSVKLANTLLTSVTWTAYYANTNDTFGTLAAPAKTQIATGTFTVNSTLTRYTTSFAVPAGATTGIEIVFSVGAQTSGTWTIEEVQLDAGSIPTTFEAHSYGQALALSQRYYEVLDGTIVAAGIGSGATVTANWIFKARKRVSPSVSGFTGTSPITGLDVTYTNNTNATAQWSNGSIADAEMKS